ncbi:MAG TPA: translocation/assembly module TamB domain-containing protein [Ramlibacter sp.]|uniref:translocation/assembly module TamB domain-containing protein n=1 Tax=Ramlibacter sp. TaxID=1917967 RepID=UPI002D7EF6C8|nr:translocation/assembly module TamB domain-containing protein [Ramlibacter sp.]HET8748598.1 translocation/assembly module TamB domain-containing protein [Ramlibacter sp.]
MKARALHAARWTIRLVVGLGLLLIVAGAGIWWWAGQEGSLAWLLGRVSGGPLQSEGVEGSIRHGWRIRRIVWERDGLRLEAEDIRLEWQPLALLEKTLHLDSVHVARARVIDRRPESDSPLQPPTDLRLPWRVTVEDLQVRELAWDGRFQLQASGLAGDYAFDGLNHRVNLKSLQVAGGEYSGEGRMLALAPMTLDAKLAGRFQAPVPGRSEPVPIEFTLRAEGPVAGIDARAQLQVLQPGSEAATLPHATATARITPFAEMPVPQGEADFRQLDAALFWPQAPRTRLSGHLEVAPLAEAVWALRGEVRNALPGPWDAGRLPVAALRAEGEWRGGTALVRSLHAEAGGGTVTGEGRWKEGGWHFAGRIEGVDPAQLHRQLAPLPLTGPLELEGEQEAIAFELALKAGAARARARRGKGAAAGVLAAAGALELRDVAAKGRWAGDALSLAMLRVRTADASLEGKLDLKLKDVAGSGELALQAPGLRANARGSLSATRGQGNAEITAGDLAAAQRWLARWSGVADALKDVALRGNGQAQLAWQGGWRDPTVQARVRAQSLAWQPPPAGPNATPPWRLREATLGVQGRLRDAAVELAAQAEQGQRKFDLAASGQLSGTLGGTPSWRGQVARLLLTVQDPALTRDAWRLQLQRPVEWRVQGESFALSAGEALLRAPAMRSGTPATDAVLTWTPLRHERGQLTTSGRLSGLPMAWIELFGGPQLAGSALSGDMVFDAEWNTVLGQTPRIDATLARVRGDVNVLAESVDGAAARVTAGVREARVRLTTEGEQVVLSLLWDSERAGHAEGEIRSRLARSADGGWEWPEQAPLSGRVQAQLPRIGVWSLLAPPGWRLRGSLTADITVAGTRAQPQLSGPVLADDLALRSVVDGIELRGGRLRAQLAGQKLTVSEFLLRGSDEGAGGGGSLLAYGEGAWTSEGPVFEAHAQLSQLRASIRSDRQLTVSGPVEARMDRSGTTVTGQLRVDRARIQIPDETPPRLGEDVVVRNAPGVAATEAERRLRPAPSESAGRTLTMKISFDLGNDFRVSGRGVDTRLVGSVEIAGASAGLPQITGLIRTAGGTYEAYGQRMNIEKGELRFTGAPDNPALDILAIRPNLTPKVGVQVTGRAQSPHVELYSEAGLSEAETLSYLVLGQSSAGGGAETALLQRAAAALLAGRGGTGKGIAGKLGLDDLTVRSEGSAGAVVRLGKRFADNFYAAYERSLSGAVGTLFIFYDISQRVTVRAEAGERSGLDLIFTFSFDGIGRR